MNATDMLNNGSLATLTPISYQVEKTIKNGEQCFSNWLFTGENTSTLMFSYAPSIGIFRFKLKGDSNTEFESRHISTTGDSILEKIEGRLFNRLQMPSHWILEGITPPNMACKVKAFDICRHLFEKHSLIPDRIAASREEGIFLAYDNLSGERSLLVEVYNDLEAGVLINDNIQKKIILSEEISSLDFSKAANLLNG
jgi:hypothetical protein